MMNSNILFVMAPSKLIGHLKPQHAGLVNKHFSMKTKGQKSLAQYLICSTKL